MAVNSTLSNTAEPFWSNRVCDALGLVPRWLEMSDIGGASGIGNVARAGLAIREGWCSTVLVIAADVPSTTWQARYSGYRPEFQEPYGVQGPPGLFGLLQRRYAEQYPLKVEALAKIAMVQREHALLNCCSAAGPAARTSHAPAPRRVRRSAYVLVSVDLPEGARVLGTLLGVAVEDVRIGMPVRAQGTP